VSSPSIFNYEVNEQGADPKLIDVLRAGLDGAMPWMRRMEIAAGAAKGLAFLHDADTPVIYRDFKASNILLDSVSDAIHTQTWKIPR